ncbi:hypothetical protein LPJ66_009667, partial [Kickxella alabastrina]
MVVLRKQRGTFWGSIREAPRDWLMHLAEDYELMDWNKISEATSWPIALALNGIFVLVSTARRLSSQSGDMDVIISTDRNYRRQKVPANVGTGSTWAGFLVFVQLFFFTLSMANAWQFFYTRRTYQMRMKEEDTSLLTSNCRR